MVLKEEVAKQEAPANVPDLEFGAKKGEVNFDEKLDTPFFIYSKLGRAQPVPNRWSAVIRFICAVLLVGVVVGAVILAWNVIDDLGYKKREVWSEDPVPSNDLLQPLIQKPVPQVLITPTDTEECTDLESCLDAMRSIHKKHVEELGLPDISYNFVYGNDGNVYEGRGWDYQGHMTVPLSNYTVSIAYMGGSSSLGDIDVMDKFKDFFKKSIYSGDLFPNFCLYTARDSFPKDLNDIMFSDSFGEKNCTLFNSLENIFNTDNNQFIL